MVLESLQQKKKGGEDVKRICITYRMEKGSEVAESCITLPMDEDVAKLVLENGADSVSNIWHILRYLAAIQGYEYVGACSENLEKNSDFGHEEEK